MHWPQAPGPAVDKSPERHADGTFVRHLHGRWPPGPLRSRLEEQVGPDGPSLADESSSGQSAALHWGRRRPAGARAQQATQQRHRAGPSAPAVRSAASALVSTGLLLRQIAEAQLQYLELSAVHTVLLGQAPRPCWPDCVQPSTLWLPTMTTLPCRGRQRLSRQSQVRRPLKSCRHRPQCSVRGLLKTRRSGANGGATLQLCIVAEGTTTARHHSACMLTVRCLKGPCFPCRAAAEAAPS